jgi:hypothetical protein
MNITLSPVTVQRFAALQGELMGLVEQDYTGLTPKLEQIASSRKSNGRSTVIGTTDKVEAQDNPRQIAVRCLCTPCQSGTGLKDHACADGSPASRQQVAPTVWF